MKTERTREKKRKISIRISKHVGYCGGVQRTLNIVEDLLKRSPDEKIYMLGEIVHNEYVLNKLKAQGLRIIHDFLEARDGLLIIQSHGISENLLCRIRDSGIRYIDTTCPMVKVIHRKIKTLDKEGYFPVIIGAADHSEVIGIAGQVDSSYIFKDPGEVRKELFKGIDRVGIVVQSTFIKEDAWKIIRKIKQYVKNVRFENTICKPTTDRQQDMHENAKKHECVFVFGSITSANTRNLYRIAKRRNRNSFLISEPEDVKKVNLKKYSRFYIISGASTPRELIDNVVLAIKEGAS